MAKFKTSSNKFVVIVSGDTIADNYYTFIRLEVKGCVTKKSNLLSWQENPDDTNQVYYGCPCYLPENKRARKFLVEYINGKTFKNKFIRSINASYRYETKEAKKAIFDSMMIKINHLIKYSFK